LNIHHLELFYHVAKHRGISAASRRMSYGIQQPAISGQIAQLEKALGTKLFHRRPFAFTPAGAKLFSEIETFFARLKELPDHVRGHAQQHLRLAAPAILLRDYLPAILARHKRLYPSFRLTLHDANQADAEELLRKREIDLAITELEDRPAQSVESLMLVRLPLVLVVPKRSKISSIKNAFRDAVPIERLISLPPHEVIPKNFRAGLRNLGLSWPPAIEVSSIDLIDVYASLGFGIGLSVAVPRRKRKAGLREIPLRDFPRLGIAALWTGELTKPAALFLQDVKKMAAKLQR
jgi:DNA-binding transcriptional LysR family regulator